MGKKWEKTAIEKGVKYWNPQTCTFNYILENGFASGRHLVVGQNNVTGYITTAIDKRSLNYIKKHGLILIK